MSDLALDLKIAFRAAAKNPAFTLVVVVTLALGIGANTAIFSLLDQVLLQPLPVKQPERLVVLSDPGAYSGATHSHSATITPFSHPMFEGLRDHNTAFDGVLGHFPAAAHLTIGGQTDEVKADLVSGSFFQVLGLAPAAGRLLTPDDDRTPGAHPVIVLSHGFWTRRFGSDPGVVGRTVEVNNEPMTVIGVAPAGFNGVEVGEAIDIFVPLMMQASVVPTWDRGLGNWRARWLTILARLKPDITITQAEAATSVLYGRLLEEDFKTVKTTSETLRTRFLAKKLQILPGSRGTSGLRDNTKMPLLVLMGMVGLVLLIACANVANLLIARASARQREVAVRLALGASRARLVRQLLVESLALSGLGALLGIVFAAWTGDVLLEALPFGDASRVLSTQPNVRMGAFAAAIALLTGIIFGLVPALQAVRPQVFPALKGESTGAAAGGPHFGFRRTLVAAQIALSLLLLIGAGLFARSLYNLRNLNPGFEPEHLLTFSVDPALNGYPLERRLALLQQLRQEIAAEPGVGSVSLAELPLMSDSDTSSTVRVEGYTSREDEDMNPNYNLVAPSFFATLGISQLAGRDFTDADGPGAPRVAVVNETFARYFFGDKDPLGRRFGLGRRDDGYNVTIVGLVRDGKAASLREKPSRFFYVPYGQDERIGGMTFYVRSAIDPGALGERLRKVAARIDPTLPVTDLKTMRTQIRESLFADRLVAALSAAFGFVAMALAAIGLYGLMSYAVSLRTREIGIRLALGAQRRAVLLMVLREATLLTATGVAVGLPAGYAAARLVESQLFGIQARDPLAFAMATGILISAALVAGYVPAARATRLDPVVALRHE